MLPLGGIGSTLNQYNEEYYLFYGLGEDGYSAEVFKFNIKEEIQESSSKKKKFLERNNLR